MGTIGGHLTHTTTWASIQQTMNGIEVGNMDMVLIANELGIRAILATGCEAFCQGARALVPNRDGCSEEVRRLHPEPPPEKRLQTT